MKNRLNLVTTLALAVIGADLSLQAVTVSEKQGIILKVADYSEKPETILFPSHSELIDPLKKSDSIKANAFIERGLAPVCLVVQNKRNEPVKISADSVRGLVDMETVFFRLFRPSALKGAVIMTGMSGWLTGFVNIVERGAVRSGDGYWWYPATIGAGCVTALWAIAGYLGCRNNQNSGGNPYLSQRILGKPTIIPPHGKVKRLLLFDLNNRPMSLDFDVYDLYDSVVASFKKISLED